MRCRFVQAAISAALTIPRRGILPWRWCFIVFLLSVRLSSAQITEPLPPGVVQIGAIEHYALVESSGLAQSKTRPGVFYSHNDGGNPAFLFALDAQGRHIGAYEVQGARLIDWEAVSVDQAGALYFADTGTNGMVHSHSAIHRVEEPDTSQSWGRATVTKSWFIRFPGEREDAESFFVLDGYGYLITKYRVDGAVNLYRFPLSDDSKSILLDLVVRIAVSGDVSDAALSPDNRRLALLTDEGVEVLFFDGNPATLWRAPRRVLEYESSVMEGIAFTEHGLMVTSEGLPQILLFNSPLLAGAPVVSRELQDQTVLLGETATFEASFIGFPAPTYIWTFNGQIIPGATNASLTIPNVTQASAGTYEVIASNAAGTARSSATLSVRERLPNLRITEVMSSQASGPLLSADWWELTSFDSEPVDLSGWRFDDSDGDLADAFVIPAGVTIAPGETIIFVEDMTPADFRAWWGESRLAPGLQIITYTGTSLSFSALGDSLRLWDDLASDEEDTLTRVDFGPADLGVSFIYNPGTEQFGQKAVPGVFGAFRSATNNDVGSPGVIDGIDAGPVDLRITEVMSSQTVGPLPTHDWWELTSFNPEPVDLSGWRFNDSDGDISDAFVIPAGVSIAPGETMIFVEDMSPSEFRAWWGESQLPPNLQIVTYSGTSLSFSSLADSLRLWSDQAAGNDDLVAQVDFGPATAGFSFIYNPVTGEFGEQSQLGAHGAFASAAGSDVASPGIIAGPPDDTIDLRITEVMSSETDAAITTEDWWELTSFESEPVDLSGWRFNDNSGDFSDAFVIPANVSIGPGETIIFVEDMTPDEFRAWWGEAEVGPGVQIITYSGSALSFSAAGDSVRLWDNETTDLSETIAQVNFGPAQTGVSFIYNPETGEFGEPSRIGQFGAFPSVAGSDIGSPGRIAGTIDRIDVRITEVMSSETIGALPAEDWWELTSFEDEPVDLSGWQFNDSDGGLTNAFILPVGLTIAPGESIVFVENLTPEEFRAWWGPARLDPALQIITYSGSSLSFSATGDSVRLWDADATQENDLAARVDFGVAQEGASFLYNPTTQVFGTIAEPGLFGAFQSASGADVGSPGIIDDTNATRLELAEGSNDLLEIRFHGSAGSDYFLEEIQSFASPNWVPTGDSLHCLQDGMVMFKKLRGASSCFYRVRKE